jgi:hypothetical protein
MEMDTLHSFFPSFKGSSLNVEFMKQQLSCRPVHFNPLVYLWACPQISGAPIQSAHTVCPPVLLYACSNSKATGQIFIKFDFTEFTKYCLAISNLIYIGRVQGWPYMKMYMLLC